MKTSYINQAPMLFFFHFDEVASGTTCENHLVLNWLKAILGGGSG
jgi:hypothetical protein